MRAARCARVHEMTAQDREHAARTRLENEGFVERATTALHQEARESWEQARRVVLHECTAGAARAAAQQGAAHAAAAAVEGSLREEQGARQQRHAATMRAVKQRHRDLVKQIRASREVADTAKAEILDRRRAIFSADRLKARNMTRALQSAGSNSRQRGSRRSAACVTSSYAQFGQQVSGTENIQPSMPTHTVQRHHAAGADGRGTPAYALGQRERQAAAERRSVAAASATQDATVARARHRAALAEVQAAAALPQMDAQLDAVQKHRRQQRSSTCAPRDVSAARHNSQRTGAGELQAAFERKFVRAPGPCKVTLATCRTARRPQRDCTPRGESQARTRWQPVDALPSGVKDSPRHELGGRTPSVSRAHSPEGEEPAEQALPTGFFADSSPDKEQVSGAPARSRAMVRTGSGITCTRHTYRPGAILDAHRVCGRVPCCIVPASRSARGCIRRRRAVQARSAPCRERLAVGKLRQRRPGVPHGRGEVEVARLPQSRNGVHTARKRLGVDGGQRVAACSRGAPRRSHRALRARQSLATRRPVCHTRASTLAYAP